MRDGGDGEEDGEQAREGGGAALPLSLSQARVSQRVLRIAWVQQPLPRIRFPAAVQ